MRVLQSIADRMLSLVVPGLAASATHVCNTVTRPCRDGWANYTCVCCHSHSAGSPPSCRLTHSQCRPGQTGSCT